jgi:aminoglycoside phosphotransferase family enzyme/predicted kinase
MNFDDIPSDINPLGLFSKHAFEVAEDQVRLIQTHISWVVLAGQYAYKLKKPVAFPFLDYGSLQKRQQFCLKEMERNKSWAGSLYIDIVGLHGDPGEVVLGEPTAEVEWCLRMHQFDQADCLLKQAELGKIPKEWIDDLAQHFVSAHSVASVAANDTLWGTSKSLSLQLDQCCLDIEIAARKMDVEIDVKSIDDCLQARLKKIESVMQRRKQLGFVRECHGDLHLGNVIRWQGHTVGFDAIEFNPDFYWIDVWNDVAFTIMDLDWRGQADNASRLMNAYAEGCGDYGGLELLSVFTSYRALVRARIAALRVHQNSAESEVAHSSVREMTGYVELAERYLQKVSPKLWITHGVSGSGKSIGSERCVEEYRAIRIRTDVERKRLAGIDRLAPGNATIYSSEFTRATYLRCVELARVVISAGYSVVIDGTFLKRWQRDLAYGLANDLAVEFEILDFDAPVEMLRERILKRASDPSDATLEVLDRQIAERETLVANERCFVKALGSVDRSQY